MPRYRVVVEEMGDERELPVREPASELEPLDWRGCGAERGAWEEAQETYQRTRVGRQDLAEVLGEYIPPGRS